MKKWASLVSLLVLIVFGTCQATEAAESKTVLSFDGSQIAYTVYGAGDVALVFVHGWSCDQSYWREQIDHFALQYTVVTIDLAGHGSSSETRQDYTLASFGEDVKAVVDAERLNTVILIGHSMGGGVIAHAAYHLPGRVRALIGVDTLQNVARPLSQEEMDAMLSSFYADFPVGTANFVRSMFPENADQRLVDQVCTDMGAAPPAVAMSAIRNYMSQHVSGEYKDIFTKIDVPVYAINARLWSTDADENRKYMKSFDVRYIEDAGHFVMLEKRDAFNALLAELLAEIL
jgi:pimeloyl-ACP methyl ester carboxylesterase